MAQAPPGQPGSHPAAVRGNRGDRLPRLVRTDRGMRSGPGRVGSPARSVPRDRSQAPAGRESAVQGRTIPAAPRAAGTAVQETGRRTGPGRYPLRAHELALHVVRPEDRMSTNRLPAGRLAAGRPPGTARRAKPRRARLASDPRQHAAHQQTEHLKSPGLGQRLGGRSLLGHACHQDHSARRVPVRLLGPGNRHARRVRDPPGSRGRRGRRCPARLHLGATTGRSPARIRRLGPLHRPVNPRRQAPVPRAAPQKTFPRQRS
jgi:hypothetical protein